MVALFLLAVSQPSYKIAFCRGGDIWTIHPDGTHERKIAETYRIGGQAHDRPIVASPDGRTLIYWDHTPGHWDLISIDANGKNKRNLTKDLDGGCRSATFSADGKQIAFMCDEPNGLYVMKPDGSGKRRLSPFGHRDEPPHWSPDGKLLAWMDISSKQGPQTNVVEVATGRIAYSHIGTPIGWYAHSRDLWISGTPGVKTWHPSEGETSIHRIGESVMGFSPKGEWFLVRDFEGKSRLRSWRGTRFVFDLRGEPEYFAWSPDEELFAYIDKSVLYSLDLTTKQPKEKLVTRRAEYCVWVRD